MPNIQKDSKAIITIKVPVSSVVGRRVYFYSQETQQKIEDKLRELAQIIIPDCDVALLSKLTGYLGCFHIDPEEIGLESIAFVLPLDYYTKRKEPKMTEKETYEVSLVCTNCGRRQTKDFTIPKGTKVWPATNEVPCENCGCTGTFQR